MENSHQNDIAEKEKFFFVSAERIYISKDSRILLTSSSSSAPTAMEANKKIRKGKKFSSATKFSMKNRKIRRKKKALEMKFFLSQLKYDEEVYAACENKRQTRGIRKLKWLYEKRTSSFCCLTCMFYELLRALGK